MSETWKRIVLYVVGAWNIVGGISALIDPGRHFAQLYAGTLSLDDPIQGFFFRATWINVIAWGVGYIVAARQPLARGPILFAGGVGKLAYFGACLALVQRGGAGNGLLVSGVLDVLFAVFFFYVLWSRRTDELSRVRVSVPRRP